ncbi:hypothetical protein [Pontibacter sp. G13]|uniref:hypothetical protein n=1 Tax=Pontibacter sp. G13 TaxID=3074898 RepID=UPI00288A675C|nr:hypothetical protein [Pontibacter sp. G13]WNJ19585.1 hypothetical protein RJD25_03780 [Pontibacter sp. G13]
MDRLQPGNFSVAPDTLGDHFPEDQMVILDDVGIVSFEWRDRAPIAKYRYVRRIWVQHSIGTSQLDIELPINGKESIQEVEASTYLQNVDGDWIPFEIPPRKIKTKTLLDGSQAKVIPFSLVKPGAILEYSFMVTSKEIRKLRPWKFQHQWPVAHSEFHLLLPEPLTFQILPIGNLRQMERYAGYFRQPVQRRERRDRSGNGWANEFERSMLSEFLSGHSETYVMNMIAAAKEESFSRNSEGLRPGLDFLLTKDEWTGKHQGSGFDSWPVLNHYVQRQLRDGKVKLKSKNLETWAESQNLNPESMVPYWEQWAKLVQQNFSWNGEYGLTANLRKLQQDQSGSGAELNLWLWKILQQEGYQVSPVLIATRNYGLPFLDVPQIGQFNHIVLKLREQGKDFWIDLAQRETYETGALPANSLNHAGFELTEDNGRWVPLNSRNRMVEVAYGRFQINPNSGQLEGDFEVQAEEYAAELARQAWKSYQDDSSQYVQGEYLTGAESIELQEINIRQEETERSKWIVSCNLETSEYMRRTEEFLFIQPMISGQLAENPFPNAPRMTPIDLNVPRRAFYMFALEVPGDFEVAQLPPPIRVNLPGKAGYFIYNAFELRGVVYMSSSIILDQTLFLPHEYTTIQSFFQYIVDKQQEDIILKRSPQ